ncbi:MAG: lipopolysaccharide assembly protein LapA domain-containing protein [Candidatus Dormibacteria bacterium]
MSQAVGAPPPGDQRHPASAPPEVAGGAPAAPAPAAVPATRTSMVWWTLGFSLLLLIVVLVFVLQNLSPVSTSLFSVKWTIPLGLDLLLATLLGAVIAFLLGTVRMVQLRRVARRHSRTQTPHP